MRVVRFAVLPAIAAFVERSRSIVAPAVRLPPDLRQQLQLFAEPAIGC
jgi:hypothetical protein